MAEMNGTAPQLIYPEAVRHRMRQFIREELFAKRLRTEFCFGIELLLTAEIQTRFRYSHRKTSILLPDENVAVTRNIESREEMYEITVRCAEYLRREIPQFGSTVNDLNFLLAALASFLTKIRIEVPQWNPNPLDLRKWKEYCPPEWTIT